MTDLAIEISNLTKTYEAGKKGAAKTALKGVDLVIPRGSFFGLLGPNGAGKSTIINIMAGLTIKSAGHVKLCGIDIDENPRAARSKLGVVPQELMLDTFFTVREALEITAGYYGVPKAKRRTNEIIEAMGLTDKADIGSRKLSGGMRRRLLVGKALVHSPPILILDEPTAGVDVELRTQLWDYVRALNKAGTTVLLTTHYLEEAEELCDEIAIINHGEIIKRDSKAKLLSGVDSKELVLTLDRDFDSGAAFADMDIHADGTTLVIKYKPSQATFEPMIDRVKQAGYHIVDLTTRQMDLEDIFRKLVRERAA